MCRPTWRRRQPRLVHRVAVDWARRGSVRQVGQRLVTFFRNACVRPPRERAVARDLAESFTATASEYTPRERAQIHRWRPGLPGERVDGPRIDVEAPDHWPLC